jgi:hypothetical protein
MIADTVSSELRGPGHRRRGGAEGDGWMESLFLLLLPPSRICLVRKTVREDVTKFECAYWRMMTRGRAEYPTRFFGGEWEKVYLQARAPQVPPQDPARDCWKLLLACSKGASQSRRRQRQASKSPRVQESSIGWRCLPWQAGQWRGGWLVLSGSQSVGGLGAVKEIEQISAKRCEAS